MTITAVQHAQRHLGCNALAIWWNLVQRVAPVVARDRLHPLALVLSQICGGQRTALVLRKARNGLCNLASVKGLARGVGNQPQGPRGGGKLKQLANHRRATARQKALGKTGQALQLRHGRGPFLRHPGRYQVAALGDLGRDP